MTPAPVPGAGSVVRGAVLKRLAAGDIAAMQACIDEYGGLVWSLARRYCATAADAEDAVQEVFVALWESAARYHESKGEEATFVAMIARRRLIDSGRRQQRRRKYTEAAGQERPAEAPGYEHRAAGADEARRALEGVATLSEAQQKVLRLGIHQGLTHEEIARSTGMPLGTVKTHARRGLMRVRELLAAERSGRGPESRQ